MSSSMVSRMTVRRWKPCVGLRPFVEAYGIREAGLGTNQVYVPLPARRDCFLEFYLQGRYRIVTVATGAEHWAPRCVLVGPSTRRREDLRLSGSLQVFSIRFSPIGFRALFRIPARLLRNRAMEAELVLGHEIVEVHEQLAEVEPAQWQAVAERYLLRRAQMPEVSRESRIAGEATAAMQRSHGRVSVAEIAARSAVSPRHLERAFQEQVGVSPKMFGRLMRLDRALELGAPGGNWAEIADVCGYFDQSHMVRDFRAMTGATPVEFCRVARCAVSVVGQCRICPIRRSEPWLGWSHEGSLCSCDRFLLLLPNDARACSTYPPGGFTNAFL